MKPVERFEHGRICPGLGFDGIKEVARVDEHIGFQVYDVIYRPEKIIVYLPSRGGSSRSRDRGG